MVGAVVLLAASIAIERSKVDCWQTSISAYYYTPVRAIFVGSMIAVDLSLIVYKGRAWEDVCLNFAGMLAPVVAVVPTTDVGRCWSVAPSPLPVNADGSLADWVVTNIDNNIYALLIAGALALASPPSPPSIISGYSKERILRRWILDGQADVIPSPSPGGVAVSDPSDAR
jgi:hypothetical protein